MGCALAAVGSADWTYWLVLWAVMGLTQGFSVFVARAFGKGDFSAMRRSMAMSAILCAMVGSFLALAGLVHCRPTLALLNTPADIVDDAVTYLTIMVAGMLVVTAYNMAAAILRSAWRWQIPAHRHADRRFPEHRTRSLIRACIWLGACSGRP